MTRLAKAMSAFIHGRSAVGAAGRDARTFAGRGESFGVDGSGAPSAGRAGAILAAALLLALVAAQPASAALKGTFFIGEAASGSLTGQFNTPRDVAVYYGTDSNASTDKVFIVDDLNHRIQKFNANTGAFEQEWGKGVNTTEPAATVCPRVGNPGDTCTGGTTSTFSGTGRAQFDNPQGIAIDQANGWVYVYDRDNKRVQRLDLDGGFQLMFGAGVNQTEAAATVCPRPGNPGDTCKIGVGGTGAANVGPSSTTTLSPRLDVNQATQDVIVADPSNRRVQQWTSAGAFSRAWGWGVDSGANQFEICTAATTCQGGSTAAGVENGRFASNQPLHVGVGPNGVVHASDANTGANNQRVMRFDSAVAGDGDGPGSAAAQMLLAPVAAPPLVQSSGGTGGIEIDSDDNHAHITRGPVLQELDAAGNLIATTSIGLVGVNFSGLGLNSATGSAFVSFPTSLGHRVLALTEAGAPPATATILPPAAVDAHSAGFQGTVTPNGPSGIQTAYRFEYSKDSVTWMPVAADANVGEGSAPVSVPLVPAQGSATGLEANALYRVRIVATKSLGNLPAFSPELSFTTTAVPPEVTGVASQQRTATTAQLVGSINPNNLATTYHFDYGPTAAYGSVVPVPEGSAGSAGLTVRVGQLLTGLEPQSTYHFRLCGTNAQGTTCSGDVTVDTRAAVPAPPGRAYEMVTPPFKNNRRGGDGSTSANSAAIFQGSGGSLPNPGITSIDGEKIMLSLFGGIIDPEAGAGFAHDRDRVIFGRSADGWRGAAVVNVPSVTGGDTAVSDAAAISGDLRVSTWRHLAPLFDSGSKVSTRVMGDSGGRQGWYEWISNPAIAASSGGQDTDASLLNDAGTAMLRWSLSDTTGRYSGLLGSTPAEDPSVTQVAGAAVYRSGPPSWAPIDLVNGCTAGTEIPNRPDAATAIPLGVQPCGPGSVVSVRGAVANALSEDGRRAFFTSPDPNTSSTGFNGLLDPAAEGGCDEQTTSFAPATGPATDCPPQLYVRQYDSSGAASVRWISRSQVAGQSADKPVAAAIFERASSDGRVVYFRTRAPLLPTDPNGGASITTGTASANSWDLYRYVLPAGLDADPGPPNGTLTRITGGPGGGEDPNTNSDPSSGAAVRAISADGSRVYFVTRGVIAGADNAPPAASAAANLAAGTATTSATLNLYLFDAGTGTYRFVALLPYSAPGSTLDACVTSASRPSFPLGVNGSRGSSSCVRGTTSGDAIAFETTTRLTADDADAAADVYVYDADADELIRASAPPPGEATYNCDGAACNADLGFSPPGSSARLGLRDGARLNIAENATGQLEAVYFQSRLQLTADDTNGRFWDTYEWRVGGRLELLSPGDSPAHSYYSGNSRDGEDVFISTSQPIDPREIEPEDTDIYDIRVGGGIPLPPVPPVCDVLGGTCTGALAGVPVGPSAASASFSGAGNVVEPPKRKPRCGKGKVKRRGKCVAKKGKGVKRTANKTGRAAK